MRSQFAHVVDAVTSIVYIRYAMTALVLLLHHSRVHQNLVHVHHHARDAVQDGRARAHRARTQRRGEREVVYLLVTVSTDNYDINHLFIVAMKLIRGFGRQRNGDPGGAQGIA